MRRYYAPDVKFRHPLCNAHDRDSLLGIYRWYRIMSPKHSVKVGSVTFDREKLELFLEVTQTFHIRWSPLSPAPARYAPSFTFSLSPCEEIYMTAHARTHTG